MLSLLYVEDHPSDVLPVTRLPQRRGGVAVQVARSGARGLQLTSDLRPYVVLLNLNLPGETFPHRLRVLPGLGATPVLVRRADASPECAERLHTAGVTAHLTKPLDMAALFAHLRPLESPSLVPDAPTEVVG